MDSHWVPGSPGEVDVPQIAASGYLSQRQGLLCVCPGRMARAGVSPLLGLGLIILTAAFWMELHRWAAANPGQRQEM